MVAAIPPGRVLTYGDVARRMASGGARSVGGVLSRYGEGLPCHRVVRSDGSVKRVDPGRNAALLAAEGVPFLAPGRVDLTAVRWLPELADRVLAVVAAIPPGRVMTYGDIAEFLGESSARAVGRVMALHGADVRGTGWCWRQVRRRPATRRGRWSCCGPTALRCRPTAPGSTCAAPAGKAARRVRSAWLGRNQQKTRSGSIHVSSTRRFFGFWRVQETMTDPISAGLSPALPAAR